MLKYIRASVQQLLMGLGIFFVFQNVVKSLSKKATVEEDKIGQVLPTSLHCRKPYKKWNDAIFFPDPYFSDQSSTTSKLLHYFDSAQKSIRICMYLCSFKLIENVIRKKYIDGIIIQVITDQDTLKQHNNHFADWKLEGVPVQSLRMSGGLMHNKFAIIDDEAVITGSLNWTKQGILMNHENVIVTTERRIVLAFSQQFSFLWNKSKY